MLSILSIAPAGEKTIRLSWRISPAKSATDSVASSFLAGERCLYLKMTAIQAIFPMTLLALLFVRAIDRRNVCFDRIVILRDLQKSLSFCLIFQGLNLL